MGNRVFSDSLDLCASQLPKMEILLVKESFPINIKSVFYDISGSIYKYIKIIIKYK